MASRSLLTALFTILFVTCATASQGSQPTCFDAQSGACTTEVDELLSVISEHTSSDHLAYVQKKAAKVQEHEHAQEPLPETALESEPEQKAELHAWAVPLAWAYTPSPADAPVEPYGPSSWSMVAGSEACGEQGTQSPINLVFGSALLREHESPSDLKLQTLGDCKAPGFLLNERTAELEFGSDDCSKSLKVEWMGEDYALVQFHYHSPSQHTIDGGYFPMEVLHVHKTESDKPLVIAVMVAVAYEKSGVDEGPANFLYSVIGKMPQPGDDLNNNRYEYEKPTPDWNPYKQFIPDLSTGFYTYQGSLTTPPCTSGTTWIIAPKAVKIPSETLSMYRKLINSNPVNQLATFGAIVGSDDNAVPKWNDASHMTDWSYLLKCNIRPIQNMTGVNNYARYLYKIGE
jgi:carbonic anhydrase